ncbi:MAG TPA: hypothetical protein VHT70_05365 [Candidatus Saccharimonadales bacterium]|jgi:hypothetical protein|nr:hypothetical protein [Candidatus Saccharimonadales bacterium]
MKEFDLPKQRQPETDELLPPTAELTWEDQPICSPEELDESLAQARETLGYPFSKHPAEAQAELILMHEVLRISGGNFPDDV